MPSDLGVGILVGVVVRADVGVLVGVAILVGVNRSWENRGRRTSGENRLISFMLAAVVRTEFLVTKYAAFVGLGIRVGDTLRRGGNRSRAFGVGWLRSVTEIDALRPDPATVGALC